MREIINLFINDGEVHFMLLVGIIVLGCFIYSNCIYHGDDL